MVISPNGFYSERFLFRIFGVKTFRSKTFRNKNLSENNLSEQKPFGIKIVRNKNLSEKWHVGISICTQPFEGEIMWLYLMKLSRIESCFWMFYNDWERKAKPNERILQPFYNFATITCKNLAIIIVVSISPNNVLHVFICVSPKICINVMYYVIFRR